MCPRLLVLPSPSSGTGSPALLASSQGSNKPNWLWFRPGQRGMPSWSPATATTVSPCCSFSLSVSLRFFQLGVLPCVFLVIMMTASTVGKAGQLQNLIEFFLSEKHQWGCLYVRLCCWTWFIFGLGWWWLSRERWRGCWCPYMLVQYLSPAPRNFKPTVASSVCLIFTRLACFACTSDTILSRFFTVSATLDSCKICLAHSTSAWCELCMDFSVL